MIQDVVLAVSIACSERELVAAVVLKQTDIHFMVNVL